MIFKKILVLISVGIGILALHQIFAETKYLQGGILLAYVGLVVWGLLSPHPSPLPQGEREKFVGEGITKGPEEIVLNIIRKKGRAKREDLLPAQDFPKVHWGGFWTKWKEKGRLFKQEREKSQFLHLEPTLKFMTQIAISY